MNKIKKKYVIINLSNKKSLILNMLNLKNNKAESIINSMLILTIMFPAIKLKGKIAKIKLK